jgi:DNA-directed RNA polymerase specialized sigma24 family protein
MKQPHVGALGDVLARDVRFAGCAPSHLENLDVAFATDNDTLLAVSEALEKLAAIDPAGAKLIELRFFAGLSNVDAAKVLGLAERSAKRTWSYARAWLHEELTKKH